MRAKIRNFAAARHERLRPPAAGEKSDFSSEKVRSRDADIFSGKKPAGGPFHVMVMQIHARTGRGTVKGVEKMLAKVPWGLQEVSL